MQPKVKPPRGMPVVRAWSFCGAWVSVIEARSGSVRDCVGGKDMGTGS